MDRTNRKISYIVIKEDKQMGRWNIRWSILLVLWCVTGVKLAAMKVESLDRDGFLIAGMNLRLRIR